MTHKIVNLAPPTADTDAATKGYVDTTSGNSFTGVESTRLDMGTGTGTSGNYIEYRTDEQKCPVGTYMCGLDAYNDCVGCGSAFIRFQIICCTP